MAVKGKNDVIVRNKRATFEYQIDKVYTAGIVLTGTEVKSLREGKASLQEAYCYVQDEEVFIRGMNISIYDQGTYNNHEPARVRKLLMKKREILKLQKALEEKGFTLVPMKLFFNDRNFVKLEMGLGKGKKLHDKRQDTKERDMTREIRRADLS